MEKVILDFIRKYYVLDFSTSRVDKKLIIRDCEDKEMGNCQSIPLVMVKGCEVDLIWNKARRITGIDLYRKDFASVLPISIMNAFRHPRTLDFFVTLHEMKVDIIIDLEDMKQELPGLFDEELQQDI
jgi:hypothetical protein